jgi:hypothetical protein
MNSDPAEPLVDLTVASDGKLTFRLEEPWLNCPCCSVGWLGCEWLYQRAPKCTCESQTDNWDTVLHALWCDSVPCPFCPAEGRPLLPCERTVP